MSGIKYFIPAIDGGLKMMYGGRDGSEKHQTSGNSDRLSRARTEFFRKNLPISTIVDVNHPSNPGLLIEISATAGL
jgi:hypothetical protein